MDRVTREDMEAVRAELARRHSIHAVLCTFGTRNRLQEAVEMEEDGEDPFRAWDLPVGATFRAFGYPVHGDRHVQEEDVLYFLNGVGMEALKVLCRYMLWRASRMEEKGVGDMETVHRELVRYIMDKGTAVSLAVGRRRP